MCVSSVKKISQETKLSLNTMSSEDEEKIKRKRKKKARGEERNGHDEESSTSERRRRKKRKEKKHRKHHKKKSKKRKKIKQAESDDDSIERHSSEEKMGSRDELRKNTTLKIADAAKEQEQLSVTNRDNMKLKTATTAKAVKSKSMAPMTKEQYEAKLSEVREVFDEESGRYRLVRGNGEIIERIVSRSDHERINTIATHSDGSSFAKSVYHATKK